MKDIFFYMSANIAAGFTIVGVRLGLVVGRSLQPSGGTVIFYTSRVVPAKF